MLHAVRDLGRAAASGVPPDFGELAQFGPHVGRVVREAVVVAAQTSKREQSEALADRIGRAVAREWWRTLETRRLPAEPTGGEG